jgi:hypothetical protein
MKKLLFVAILGIGMITTSDAFSANYILHLNGMCSMNWLDSSGARLASASGYTSINCYVDNTQSISFAASQFKTKYLDVYCKGSNWCYIINYSAGDAIVGYINGIYAPSWNIGYVVTAAGASGGSEVANSFTSLFACSLTKQLAVSTIRGMYNHNDTNGIGIYRTGGYKAIWYSPGSAVLPGEDDGAVAYHSSAGCVSTGSYNRLDTCSRWTNHYIYGDGKGYYLDHYGMKMKGISLRGW